MNIKIILNFVITWKKNRRSLSVIMRLIIKEQADDVLVDYKPREPISNNALYAIYQRELELTFVPS